MASRYIMNYFNSLRKQKKHNWYTCFDPVGTMGNVHFLIVNKEEHVAGKGALVLAKCMGQANVTLKRIKPREHNP